MTHDEREPRDTPPEDQPQAQPADRRTDADGATPDETFADRPSGGPPPSEVEAYAAPPSVHTEPAMPAHSVPATEPGESTRCPRCGTENRPGISFCRSCGQRLVAAGTPTTVERPAAPEGTQQCPRCGTHNRAGVAFCQNCGANLRAAPPPEPGYV
ncbi:MAG TPA: zinc-ribbon domain-containing protein, partial [candidate division Zixibacteria bacterium]|nr:zinc-ribbon domain-containing protein [candidate division Zixibacteria bacterium]